MHRKMIYFEKSKCYISLRNNHSGEKKGSVLLKLFEKKLVLPVWSSIIWSFILYYRYIQVNYSGIDELLINCCVAVELLMMAMMHDNERL